LYSKGFVKVRYLGLWGSASRDKLETARRILDNHHAAIRKKLPRAAPSADAASDSTVPKVRMSLRPASDHDPQVQGASVRSASFPHATVRICGPGKLRATSKTTPPSALAPPETIPSARLPDPATRLRAPTSGVLPTRVAPSSLSAFD
jgi:hypothetical protein